MANPPPHRLIGGEWYWTGTLGAGSFATVFRAQHKTRRNEVAIKSISRERLNRKLQENLESEISILLNFRHPNIVELYDIKKTERHIYLICELCAGGDLQKFIRRHKRLAEPVARHFMRHLTAGLRFLWQQSLIHRDLKPQNLLLTSTEPTAVLKIADFGFARHLAAASMAETLCGSPLYMAPEVLQGRRYDAKADLWSVGTILYEMVVGRPPFGGANHVELLRCIHSRPLSVPNDIVLSDGCLDVLRLLLRRDPLQRASFEDFFAHPFVAPEPAAATAAAGPASATATPSAGAPVAGLSERLAEPPSPSRGAAAAATHAAQMLQVPPSSGGRCPSGSVAVQGSEDAAALTWQSYGHRYAQQDGRPLHPLPQPVANAAGAAAAAAGTHWPMHGGGAAAASAGGAMFSSDLSTGSHVSSPPFAAGQQHGQQQQQHGGGMTVATTIAARAMPWHDASVVPSGRPMHLSGRQGMVGRQGYAIPAAVAPQTPHHQPFKPLAASPPGGAAAVATSALLGRHGSGDGDGAWLPPPLSLGAPAYSPDGGGGSDSMTGSDDYVMVDQCLEPYPFHGQALPLRSGNRLAHRLGSRAVATAAAVAAAAAAAAASASSGYIGIPRFSDASGMPHAQVAVGGGPQISAAAAALHNMGGGGGGGGGGSGAVRFGGPEAVVAVARCLHLVELFGRRAVLLAQLGDARVKAAREALQAGYIAGHAAAARRRAALAGNSLSASLLFGPIDGLGDDVFGDGGCCGSGVLTVQACGGSHGGGSRGDAALLPPAAESKWEPLSVASPRGGTSMSAAEAAAPALQEQGIRLFGEALVLYMKSLGMIRTAATWGQQAVGGGNGGGGSGGTAVEEQFARGRTLLLWLRQQSSAVLDRADQCKARLKERGKAPAPLPAAEHLSRGGGGGGGAENDGVVAASLTSVGLAAVAGAMAVSAEYLVFDAALRLAQEGAVMELLGQFAEGRDCYDKACVLIETLLLDGSVERPGGPANRRYGGGGYGVTGGGDAAFASGASRSNIVAGGGGSGAAGSLCESERRTLHSYLESFARRAEHLAREADAAAMTDTVAAGPASSSQAPQRGAGAAAAGASALGGIAASVGGGGVALE